MPPEKNQNQENTTTEENPVSAEPKQEVVEPVVENPEIIKSEVFSPVTEIINGEPKETQPIEQIENVETKIID
ncbi:hypothetical protein L6261_03635 [Candidatus Parcubacteria bacterium]|nr:hypothetical protein [Candidatus Parcubacteria bacterium]